MNVLKTEQQIISKLLQIKGCRYRILIGSNALFYQGLKIGFIQECEVYIRVGNSNYHLFQALEIERLNVIEFELTTYAELPENILMEPTDLKIWIIAAYREACRRSQLEVKKSKNLF